MSWTRIHEFDHRGFRDSENAVLQQSKLLIINTMTQKHTLQYFPTSLKYGTKRRFLQANQKYKADFQCG